jgi:hypothetical protein
MGRRTTVVTKHNYALRSGPSAGAPASASHGRDMYNPADLDPIREKALLRLWNVLDTGETLSLRQSGDGDEGSPPLPPGK